MLTRTTPRCTRTPSKQSFAQATERAVITRLRCSQANQLHRSKRSLHVESLARFQLRFPLASAPGHVYSPRRFFSSASEKLIKVPGMGDSITEGTIQKWSKAVGDFVTTDELIVSIETDKVVVDIRAPSPGKITHLFAKEGDTVQVGSDLYKLDTAAPAPKEAKPAAAATAATTAPPSAPAAAKPTPSAPSPAPSPSPSPAKEAAKPQPTSPAAPSGSSAQTGLSRSEHKVKMSRMRLRIAERLKDSQNTYAMLTTFNEIDMNNIMALRNKYKDEFQEKHGVKLGFMSAFVRAAVAALKDQPVVNAVIDGDEIVYRNYIDVSVAVATPTGLVVPVLRDCENMSFADVEKTIASLGKKARDGALKVEDMAGGTFTISNGGVYGSMMGTPIINPPQSAILGMHAINKRAVVVNDKVEIRPMMYVALTYDHRLIDGREAVTFLRKIKDVIEDPQRLLLDV